ncbi:MAG: metallophosphoesterase [Planctomycetota bacterium]
MQSKRLFHRRNAVRLLAGAVVIGGAEPSAINASASWKMGLISDLHFGLAPDALSRLEAFMQRVDEVKPDSILQLGDFNYGVDSRPCMDLWNQFDGPKYHVLGNHDMDKSAKEAMVELWSMPSNYYSFDHKGWHFVILDRNHLRIEGRYIDYKKANFYVDAAKRGFADPEQLEWLADDLEKNELPTVVFAHQGLGMSKHDDPDSPQCQIEIILAQANHRSGDIKACLCGHHHIDRYRQKDGIHYLWINSASYYWVGSEYGRMAPYKDPLFTFLTFHLDRSIEIAACNSSWSEPSPKQRGYPTWEDLNTQIVARKL